jgi:hypothetical protein
MLPVNDFFVEQAMVKKNLIDTFSYHKFKDFCHPTASFGARVNVRNRERHGQNILVDHGNQVVVFSHDMIGNV